MATKPSVFGSIPDQNEQGPFSEFLKPQTASAIVPQPQAPSAAPTKAGAVAGIATNFLEGAARGRIMKYARDEEQRHKSIQDLGTYMQGVANDPRLDDQTKSQIQQRIFRAIAGEGARATEQANKDKQGNPLLKAFHQIFIGATGGKIPKVDQLNVNEVIGGIQRDFFDITADPQTGNTTIAPKPQHNIQTQQQQLGQTLQNELKEVDNAQDAQKIISKHFSEISQRYPNPQDAERYRQSLVGAYPDLGSPAYYDQGFTKSFQGPPGTTPQAGPPELTPRQMSQAEMAKRVADKGDIEFTDPATGKVVRRYAQYIQTPRGSYWYTQDANGNPQAITAPDVRKTGLAGGATKEAYGKPQRGSDLNFDKDADGNPRDPNKTYVRIESGDREGKYISIIPPRTEARMGRPVMGNQLPRGTLDVLGRPIAPNQLYTPTLDSAGTPRGYMPTAIQNEYKIYYDPETNRTYAISVPRYPGASPGQAPGFIPAVPGATPEPPGPTPEPGAVPAPAPKPKPTPVVPTADLPKQAEKRYGRSLTEQQTDWSKSDPFALRTGTAKPSPPQPQTATAQPPGGPPPGAIPLGGRPLQRLDAASARAIVQVKEASDLAMKIKEILETKDPKTGKALKDIGSGNILERLRAKAGRIENWAEYRAGIQKPSSVEARLAKATEQLEALLNDKTSFIALDEIVGAAPYSAGRSSVQMWSATLQHLPSPTDNPAEMYEKLKNMLEILPGIDKTIKDTAVTLRMGTRLIGPGAQPIGGPPPEPIPQSPFAPR